MNFFSFASLLTFPLGAGGSAPASAARHRGNVAPFAEVDAAAAAEGGRGRGAVDENDTDDAAGGGAAAVLVDDAGGWLPSKRQRRDDGDGGDAAGVPSSTQSTAVVDDNYHDRIAAAALAAASVAAGGEQRNHHQRQQQQRRQVAVAPIPGLLSVDWRESQYVVVPVLIETAWSRLLGAFATGAGISATSAAGPRDFVVHDHNAWESYVRRASGPRRAMSRARRAAERVLLVPDAETDLAAAFRGDTAVAEVVRAYQRPGLMHTEPLAFVAPLLFLQQLHRNFVVAEAEAEERSSEGEGDRADGCGGGPVVPFRLWARHSLRTYFALMILSHKAIGDFPFEISHFYEMGPHPLQEAQWDARAPHLIPSDSPPPAAAAAKAGGGGGGGADDSRSPLLIFPFTTADCASLEAALLAGLSFDLYGPLGACRDPRTGACFAQLQDQSQWQSNPAGDVAGGVREGGDEEPEAGAAGWGRGRGRGSRGICCIEGARGMESHPAKLLLQLQGGILCEDEVRYLAALANRYARQ